MADTTLTGTLSTTFVDKPDDVLSAKTYADAAANAANAASTSENNAATSEANSKKSETAAKTSETNAASSATAAATSETNAASSKTAAATSASAAASSATAAAQSESNALTYEQQAKSQAYSAITTVATLTYATDAEATAGTATDRMISPATLKAVIDADKATNDEAKAGTSDKVITASALKAVIDSTVLAAVLLAAYPVGALYWSSVNTNPSTLFGGTWAQVKDKFILAAGDTYSAGNTGGEANHVLTTSEMPSHGHSGSTSTNGNHSHTVTTFNAFGSIYSGGSKDYCIGSTNRTTSTAGNHQHSLNIDKTGGGAAHNNMPPYQVYYCWERTA